MSAGVTGRRGAARGGDGYGAARGGDGYGRRRIRAAWGGDGARGKLGLPGTSRDLDDGRRGTAGDTTGRDPSEAAGPCDRMTTIDATASGTVGRRPGTVDADEPGVRGSSSRARRVGETVDPLSRRACGGHSGRIARTGVYPGSLTWCLSAPPAWPIGSQGCGRRSRFATRPQRASIARTRLRKPTPAGLGARITRGRSITVIACAPGVHRRWPPPRRPSAPPWAVPSGPTCPPPSCTRTPSATARASSRPTGRSSSGPASTPAGRPRTSSSSMSHRATRRSGGARSTARSPRRTTIASGRASSSTPRRRTCTARTASSAPRPPTGGRCGSIPRPPGRACSRATCSAGRAPRGSATSPRTSRSSACPRSRPTPRPRGRAPARPSWSTCAGWRS